MPEKVLKSLQKIEQSSKCIGKRRLKGLPTKFGITQLMTDIYNSVKRIADE
jgi:hypothetical protein